MSFVLEVEQADERLLFDNVLEKELGGVIGGDAGGKHAADAAAVGRACRVPLGEDACRVDVATAAERVAAAVAHEVALALGLARVIEERCVELGVSLSAVSQSSACARRRSAPGDFRASFGEPLLLLELDAFPRRISEHAVEAALREHLRERQMPVEEPVLA